MRTGISGDLKGGAMAALTAVPVELVYGLFAVAPLGMAYAEHGMRAALWGCILGGLLGWLFRGTGGMLTGTRAATGLILGSLAAHLLNQQDINTSNDPALLVFTLLLACTALAGIFQVLFDLARIDRVLKYIPFPVTSGLMLGVGILMLIGSLRPALGADPATPWSQFLGAWHPASLLVTGITLAICFLAPRWIKRIPGTILAFLFGSLVHHGLVMLMGMEWVGGTSPDIAGLLPEIMIWNAGVDHSELVAWLPTLVSYALTIAALGSLETLLCLSAIGNAQAKRLDGQRELRVQGWSNLIAGLSGATACIGNLSRVSVNLASGGHGRLSGIAYAVTLGLIILLLGNYLGWVPQAVTAGIVIYYAVGMVDDGSRRVFGQLYVQLRHARDESYRALVANATVILLVAAVAVIGDMMQAVGFGVAAAMFLFVRTRMRPVVRRIAFGGQRRSLRILAAEDAALLDREGGQIAIIEVEGPLFFGTVDNLAREIEKVSSPSDMLIIDLKHVSDIDSTGARTLLQIARQLVANHKQLLLSAVPGRFASFLNSMGLAGIVPQGDWHQDLDHALEDAENRLLTRLGGHVRHRVLALAETDLASGLSNEEVAQLAGFLAWRKYESPVELFHVGDAGDSLFVVGGSSVDILIPLQDGRQKRIVSLAPGVIFGEMALLEGKQRSTTAVLREPSETWELSRTALDRLLHAHPQIARQVLFNVGRQLASRLRAITAEVMLLEGE